MKRLIFIFLLFNFSTCFSQKIVKERKVETVVEEASFYLNGELRKTLLNGETRTIIPIQLPLNTEEWYYSFTTNSDGKGTKNLNLGLQLSSLLLDPTGLTSELTNNVEVPQGNSQINTFLLDYNGSVLFQQGEAYRYISEGSRSSVNSGVVKVKGVTNGSFYLGIENKSDLDGVNISIEVMAITVNDKYIDEWTVDGLRGFEEFCRNSFNTNSTGKIEVCECVKEKISKTYLPSDFANKENIYAENIIHSFKENCYSLTNQTELYNKERAFLLEREKEQRRKQEELNKLDDFVKIVEGANAVGNYTKAKTKMIELLDYIPTSSIKVDIPTSYMVNLINTTVWYSILDNDKGNAIKYLEKGLGYSSSDPFLKGNLGLYHLLYGDYNQSLSAFNSYKKGYKLVDGRKWGKVISEDLDKLESLGRGNVNFDKVRKDLKIK